MRGWNLDCKTASVRLGRGSIDGGGAASTVNQLFAASAGYFGVGVALACGGLHPLKSFFGK